MNREWITFLLFFAILVSGCKKNEKSPVEEITDQQKTVQSALGKRNDVVASSPINSRVSAPEQLKNSPPQITALLLENPAVHRGVDIRIIPEANDPDGDYVQFRYRWFINDSELSIENETLPGDQFRKGDRVSVRVQPFDAQGDGPVFFGEEFVIPNAPPGFISTPPTRFKAALYSYQAKALDPDDEPLTYSLIQGPGEMIIDKITGHVSWNIRQEDAGMHTVIIEVRDQDGMKSLQEWQLNISIE